MPWGSYRDAGHTQQKGPRVEHQTEREARQGTLAVYDRRRTRETEKTLSDSFNMPTVCPSVASRNLLLYQSLPTRIPLSTGRGEEAKR